jgi:aspartyl/asparaginyl beta-hydroxylase (cupin superfamily)
MTSYSIDRIGEKWEEIAEEAERCMVMRPLSKDMRPKHNPDATKELIEKNREKWVKGWSNANDYDDKHKWYNYGFVFNGKFFEENKYDFPVTYNALFEMNKHFPIYMAGYSWLFPKSHIRPHQDGGEPGTMTIHLGLSVPDLCFFNVSNSEYQHQNGKFIIFDDSDIHEAYNLSNESRIVLYIKAKAK